MKVLLTAHLSAENGSCGYVDSLVQALAPTCELSVSRELFWSSEDDFRIIHIQWPEQLVCWREPTELELLLLRRRLDEWRRSAGIVVTRHNLHPHYRDSPNFRELYRLVYEAAHAVIHLGEYSRTEYGERYPDLAPRQVQALIPHGDFALLPNTADPLRARQWLGIPADRFVVTSFGALRHREEAELLMTAFARLTGRRNTLLAPRWLPREKPSLRRTPLARIGWEYDRFRYRHSASYRFSEQFVPDGEVQYYLHGSDVVFIPRREILNSGNLPLAFTFGRVVVGPDVGNVGEILRQTGNPVFDPRRIDTAVAALEAGRKLAAQGYGDRNRQLAETEWNWQRIAGLHGDLYRKIAGDA